MPKVPFGMRPTAGCMYSEVIWGAGIVRQTCGQLGLALHRGVGPLIVSVRKRLCSFTAIVRSQKI